MIESSPRNFAKEEDGVLFGESDISPMSIVVVISITGYSSSKLSLLSILKGMKV